MRKRKKKYEKRGRDKSHSLLDPREGIHWDWRMTWGITILYTNIRLYVHITFMYVCTDRDSGSEQAWQYNRRRSLTFPSFSLSFLSLYSHNILSLSNSLRNSPPIFFLLIFTQVRDHPSWKSQEARLLYRYLIHVYQGGPQKRRKNFFLESRVLLINIVIVEKKNNWNMNDWYKSSIFVLSKERLRRDPFETSSSLIYR